MLNILLLLLFLSLAFADSINDLAGPAKSIVLKRDDGNPGRRKAEKKCQVYSLMCCDLLGESYPRLAPGKYWDRLFCMRCTFFLPFFTLTVRIVTKWRLRYQRSSPVYEGRPALLLPHISGKKSVKTKSLPFQLLISSRMFIGEVLQTGANVFSMMTKH